MFDLLRYIERDIESKTYWTNTLGLARSSLAFGLLLTLVFNNNNVLFSYGINNEYFLRCGNGISIISIFCLFNNVALAKYISIGILCLVVIGIYPRLTCIFHWWITFSFVTASYIVDGGDQIASILTLFLIPICIFDKRKWHWSIKTFSHTFLEKNIAYFSYVIISIQAAVIYFHSAIGKFKVTEWRNGTALYYWFNDPLFGMNSSLLQIVNPFLKNPFIILTTTWGVIILELFLSSNIFIRNKRIKFFSLFLGLFFHFLIIVIHGLVSFFFSMAGLLLLYLISKNFNYAKARNNRFHNFFGHYYPLFPFSTKDKE